MGGCLPIYQSVTCQNLWICIEAKWFQSKNSDSTIYVQDIGEKSQINNTMAAKVYGVLEQLDIHMEVAKQFDDSPYPLFQYCIVLVTVILMKKDPWKIKNWKGNYTVGITELFGFFRCVCAEITHTFHSDNSSLLEDVDYVVFPVQYSMLLNSQTVVPHYVVHTAANKLTYSESRLCKMFKKCLIMLFSWVKRFDHTIRTTYML